MFRLVRAAVFPCEQTSQYGSVSSTKVPSVPLVGAGVVVTDAGPPHSGAAPWAGGAGRGGPRRRPAALRHGAVDRCARPAEHAKGVAGGEVEGAARRLPRHGGEAVVAEREVLRVVPERGDGIAVEVAHHCIPLPRARLVAELAGVGGGAGVKTAKCGTQ